MKNVIGTVIGAAIDRKDGDSGVKGAILGYITTGAIKTVAKVGTLAAVGYGVFSFARNRARS